MSRAKTKAVMPRLRFPEFRDAGPWEVKRLGEVCEMFSGGTPLTGRASYYGGDIPFIRSAEIGLSETELRLTRAGFENSSAKMVEVGDVLLALYGANSGEIAISAIKGAINQAILCLRPSVSSKRYLYYLFTNRKNWIIDTYLQGGQGNLSSEIVKSISAVFPSLPEQQKIADCLSSLDDLIRTEASRLEALQAHKKGLMQQLFPAEGETTPRLRFPEFRNAGPWEVKRLGEIATRVTEQVGSKKLTPVSITASCGFVPQTTKFGRDISGKQYAKYIRLRRGQFAYNKGNSKSYPQGAVYQLLEFPEAAAPNVFYCFQFKEGYFPEFYKGYFKLNFHGSQLEKFITSGARSNGLLNIRADDFFSIILPTPREKAEQQKIADCLASLDELIRAQGEKIEALKLHKKGLMQQLFPQEVD